MSVVTYLASGKSGERSSPLREALATETIRALEKLREYGKVTERYESVEDYDPVLKAHCRL